MKHKHSQLAALLMNEIETLPLAKARVLEVGCENGWFAGQIKGYSYYLGIEPAADMVDTAQSHFPQARFVEADFLTWVPEAELFDIVLFVDKLAHMPEQKAIIAKMARLIRPGGYLVLTTENPFVYTRICWVQPQVEGRFRKWLTAKELHTMINLSGLRVARSYTVLPAGELGILKIINARKINQPLQKIIPERWITQVKERCGLGQFRVVIAQRPI